MEASFSEGHPARVAYAEYAERFRLSSGLVVVAEGDGAFDRDTLLGLRELVKDLRRRPDTAGVTSVLDLIEPRSIGGRLALHSSLGAAVLDDPAALERQLADQGWRDRWGGVLFGKDLKHWLLLIEPNPDAADPAATEAYMAFVEERLEVRLGDRPIALHLAGKFFLNQETMRATFRDQIRLSTLSGGLQIVVLTMLFGRLLPALIVSGLIGLATYLSVLGMALLGIPMNFMSGNLPVMVGVIGLADLLHILGQYAQLRGKYKPRGAAIRSMRRCLWPNFFTTVTTLGCVALSMGSSLYILATFSAALSLGVAVVYLVTIIYGPLLLRFSGIEDRRGGYAWLQEHLENALAGDFLRRVTRRPIRIFWGVAVTALVALTASQHIDSNWHENFRPGSRMGQSLDALHRRGIPTSTVDYTVATGVTVTALLRDEARLAQYAALEQAIEAVPGVDSCESLLTTKRGLDEAWKEIAWPKDLRPAFRAARRRSVYRQFLSIGAFDRYWDITARELRLVVSTPAQSSTELLDLDQRVRSAVQAATPELEPVPRGSLLLWAEIIDAVLEGTVATLCGSLVVIFLCFLAITGSTRLAWIALVPNLVPLLALFASAKLMGHSVSEEFCTLSALTIGISVDDSLHVLYHYQQARRRGATTAAALAQSYRVCGAAVALTTLCLEIGFLLCLNAEMVPVWRTGAFLTVAIGVALLADMSLLPALVLRFDREPPPGEDRGYRTTSVTPTSAVRRRSLLPASATSARSR